MGAFYGAVFLRTTERDSVRPILERLGLCNAFVEKGSNTLRLARIRCALLEYVAPCSNTLRSRQR